MTGPLAGIRVIDMTTVYSGPIAGAVLGDQGADVVKVEAPDGDMQRRMFRVARNGVDGQFAFNNRNKRSIVVDLSGEQGKQVLRRLIESADVLMENFRPDVMARLGFDYDTVHALNPKLVYASINGVGPVGPYSGRRVYDAVIQAISGMTTLQQPRDSDTPVMLNTLACDKITSMTAAQAITAALVARGRTGEGQRVEISMLDAALFFMWPDAMQNEHFVGDDVPPVGHNDHSGMVRKTKDGFVITMPVQQREWHGVYRALGLEELLSEDGLATPQGRNARENRAQLIREAYASFTTEEVCRRLEEHGVPFALMNTREQVVNDPQVRAMGPIEEFDHATAGRIRQPRPPGRFGSTPAGLSRGSPGLGEHTREVLKEAGYEETEIASLYGEGVVAGAATD